MTRKKHIIPFIAGWLRGVLFLVAVTLFPAPGGVSAQSTLSFQVQVPAVALVDIEPAGNTNLTLSLAPPTEAGHPIKGVTATDQTLWLNYTSSLPVHGPSRSIYVQAAGTIPAGVEVRVSASPHVTSSGKGAFGIPVPGPVTLGNQPQLLISGIRGCHTGDGAGNGHQLTYAVHIAGYDLTDIHENNVIQISYTITDL